jgi:hypothetical protein
VEYHKFKFSDLKEVNKLKKEIDFSKIPYFETKVIKVKKHNIEQKVKTFVLERVETKHIKGEIIKVKYNDPKLYLYRHEDSKVGDEAIYPDRKIWKIIKIIEPKKIKANIVNGENIDKIKFPCLCNYTQYCKKYLGQLNTGLENNNIIYELYSIDKQDAYVNRVAHSLILKELILRWDIHILKGKILIFEEEK